MALVILARAICHLSMLYGRTHARTKYISLLQSSGILAVLTEGAL